MADEDVVAQIREAIRVELSTQFDGDGWIDRQALTEGDPWIQIDGTLDIQQLAEAIARVGNTKQRAGE